MDLANFYEKKAILMQGDVFQRIDKISEFFMGVPYLGGALGEGENGQYDHSPIIRDDAFDCLTYVNTVLAIASSDSPGSCIKRLLQLNYYDGDPKFEKRFHFMSVDWNLQNQKNGFIDDLTATVVDQEGVKLAEYARGEVDRPAWFLKRIGVNVGSVQVAEVPFLPIDAVVNNDFVLRQMPDVSIVEIVRPNWSLREKIGTQLHVSHIGFVIRQSDGLLYFRHASSDAGCVTEQLLTDYLEKYVGHETVKGINIQCIKV